MGVETALIVAGGALEGVSAAESISSADLEKEQLNLKSKEQKIQYQQKTLQNYDALEKVTDAQLAQATVKGVSLNSPSFNAIQRNTVNTSAKNQQNLDLEESLGQQNIKIEKKNVQDSLFASLFGSAAQTSMSFASLAQKMPK